MSVAKRILFLSNGHGEDNHSAYIIQALRELEPEVEIAALPIVGEGQAYRRLQVPIIGPTQTMPSGGFTYVNRLLLLRDIGSGLIGLTWQQIQAVRRYAPSCDLIMATGDIVSQAFAYITGRPFVSFISCLSSLYEGRLRLGPLIGCTLRSRRCLTVITKDPYTAQDLQQQGLSKAMFGGIPAMDRLQVSGKDLELQPHQPMIALLPGSRLPEAERNFALQLQLVLEIAKLNPSIQFRAALVPNLMNQLPAIAAAAGWHCDEGRLTYSGTLDLQNLQDPQASQALSDLHQVPGLHDPLPDSITPEVLCFRDAFGDIIHQTSLVIGMAGLAVEQAAALGKPVIHIAGKGPQFNYPFAEAQTRLIGFSAQMIGTEAATPQILQQAARRSLEILEDPDYLAACLEHGRHRFGPPGGSFRIAKVLLQSLGYSTEAIDT